MTTASAPLALAMGFLVLAIVLAMLLIPVLDAELRRANARRIATAAAANDNDTSPGGLEMIERSDLHREVVRLRERVDVLEEEVRQLRDAFEPSVAMPVAWKLTKTEARLLHLLARVTGGYVKRERILTALYGLEPDVDIKIIDVFVCKLRKKLAAAGSAVEIRTFNGDGFGLTPEARVAFRAETASRDEAQADDAARAEAEELRARLTMLAAENARLIEAATLRSIAPAPVVAIPTARPRWSWRDLPQRDRRRHM